MIYPASIGNKDCKHIFCKRCLERWNFAKFDANSPNRQMGQNENQKQCPICRRKLNKITVEPEKICKRMKRGIPITIYQQLLEESESRFQREYLVNQHQFEREAQILAQDNPNGQN